MPKPYLLHLKTSESLRTPYAEVRAGFVALALERNRRATPFVAQARDLKAVASRVNSPGKLVDIPEVQAALLTAAGISDKAASHLEAADKKEAIQGLIRDFLEPAGSNFVEELVFRFLLTRGDTLGGSLRNVGGFLAQCKLTRSILAHLRNAGVRYRWLGSEPATWTEMSEDEATTELSLRGVSWTVKKKARTLLYNVKVPLVRNNIDLCLFNCSAQEMTSDTRKTPTTYLALGELKGGIDPAGADEHWKTSRAALGRIHSAFGAFNLRPKAFFIGAAVEAKMAGEIWDMLVNDTLDNAANLTDETQLASMTQWLCTL